MSNRKIEGIMKNRPQYLKDNLKFYSEFPAGFNLDVDYACLPKLLNFDFHTLNGLLPLTESRFDFVGRNGTFDGKESTIIEVNPSPFEYEYYESIGVKGFQAISIVVNFYAVNEIELRVLRGLPYCVSLLPATRNGEIDLWEIELLKRFDLRELCQEGGTVFTNYAPFTTWKDGVGMDYSLFSSMESNEHTDSIGFEWGMYFLSPIFNNSEILIPQNTEFSRAINSKYKKYKSNRYFKPFLDGSPRQIWGCDSPIELFLLQGLYIRKKLPEIQMGFYRSGEIFPNYYKMGEYEVFLPEDRLITTADFYFPDKGIAIFCDGKDFHDVEKDKKIDVGLNAIGVKSLRFSGKRITEDLENVLDEIETALK